MANIIPENKIEEVRQANDIVDVVSGYVQLKKQGRNHFGLCPFHNENTPSFSVNEEKQIFHCFGCGKGGNVFSFVMEIEHYNFIEAVKYLAEQSQIQLPEIKESNQNKLSEEASNLLDAYEWLNKYYHHLLKYTENGEQALGYFKERGINQETIDTFQLGYAPNDETITIDFLLNKGFHQQALIKSGVLSMKGQSATDPFRGRIVFPINNHLGKTVGFGGRAIKKEHQPKYLNSPENELFHKGNLLYNFDLAKNEIRKKGEVIVLEGYMDVITAYQAGFKNTVATLGTALTEFQAKLLKRYAETVIIAFDADQAGIEASYQAALTLQKIDADIRIARIPNQSDPDKFILDKGSDAFQSQVLDQSQTFTKFYMEYKQKDYNLTIESDRLEYIEEMIKHLSTIQNEVERELYIKDLKNKFDLTEETLTNEVNRHIKNNKNAYQAPLPEAPPIQKQASNRNKTRRAYENAERYLIANLLRNNKNAYQAPLTETPPIKKQESNRNKTRRAYENAERYLIANLLRNNFTQKIQNEIGIDFNLDIHQVIVIHIYALLEDYETINVSQLYDKITDEKLMQTISDIALIPVNDDITEEEINDYIQTVYFQANKQPELDKLKKELAEAEQAADTEKASAIALEIIRLTRNGK